MSPEDRLMPLKEAARMFLGDVRHVHTLKAEIGRGNLIASKIGRSYWTTLPALRDMETKCRVEATGRNSGSTKTETDTQSLTADPAIAQGSALRKLDELKKHFETTSQGSTSRPSLTRRSSPTSSRHTPKSTSKTPSPGNTSNTI